MRIPLNSPLNTGDAHLHITHTEVERWPQQDASALPVVRRATVISVELPTGIRVEGTAVCIPPDQFVKKRGRELAAKKLAIALVPHTTREDRRNIMWAIFAQPKPVNPQTRA